jgi:hypothetical protein
VSKETIRCVCVCVCVYCKSEGTEEEVIAARFKAESRYKLLRLVLTFQRKIKRSEVT